MRSRAGLAGGLSRGLAALLVCFLAVHAELARAQETVSAAVFSADLTDPHLMTVRVEYELVGAAHGSDVPATLLMFGPGEPTALTVGADGRPAEFASGPGRARTVLLPVEMSSGAVARAVAQYAIRLPDGDVGGRFRVHLPVLSPDRAPAEARPGLFRGEVLLPATWRISETFPTGLTVVDAPSGGSDEAALKHVVELQVVPASVSFWARPDGSWRPGLPLVLEALTALVLLVFSFFGWRHLRADVP